MTTIFISLLDAEMPSDCSPAEAAMRTGLKWEKWESQAIADQIKLTGCTNIPAPLPTWLRRAKD